MASVRFENVSISYGAKQVVKDFSLSVNDGEIMGIIGPSGCGKTTLIRALCGLIKPENGNIYINEINTIPGFTAFSMFPLLWENTGSPYSETIERIIRLGYERYNAKNNRKADKSK